MKTFPVLVYVPFTENNYNHICELARKQNKEIEEVIGFMVEVGLLTLGQFIPGMEIDHASPSRPPCCFHKNENSSVLPSGT
ncbi:MAG: hypothetical protein SCH71_06575 [Desulfobulbaceae bacterium]|nr:hypothetical protein [Desulfobulbaceae bacterium]